MPSNKLPEGVVLVDSSDPLVVDPRYIPVLRDLMRHVTPPRTEDPQRALLEQEFNNAMRAYREDFSCGKAIQVIVGTSIRYEPADLNRRVGEHLTTFLATLNASAKRSWMTRLADAFKRWFHWS